MHLCTYRPDRVKPRAKVVAGAMFETMLDVCMPLFLIQLAGGWAIIAINRGIAASADNDLLSAICLPPFSSLHGWRKVMLAVFPVAVLTCIQVQRLKEGSIGN